MNNYNVKAAFIKFFILLLFISPLIYYFALQKVYGLELLDLSIEKHFNSIYYALQKKTEPSFTLLVYIALLTPLAGFIPRLGVKGEYGSAAFADNSLIKKMGLFSKTGLVLGKVGRKEIRYEDSLSTLVLAPPGTGKTTSISITNLLTVAYSFFVLDVKKELFDITSRVRKNKFNSKIYKYNPGEKGTLKFNPFCKSVIGNIFHEDGSLNEQKWNYIEQTVEEIAYLIYPEKNNFEYWVEEGRNLFILIALWIFFTKGYTSIPEIRSFAMEDFETLYPEYEYEEGIDPLIYFINIEILKNENDIDEIKEIPARIKEEAIAVKKKADKEYSGVYSSFKSPLNIFGNSIIAENFSTNEFNIEDFRKEISTVYISINEKDLKRLAACNRVFIEYNLRKLASIMPEKNDIMTVNLLDEFPRFGRMEYMLELPSIGRGYKIISMLIAQDYAQIKKVYTPEDLSIIESTTAYKVIFPQTNEETANRYAELIGDFTVERASESKSLDAKGSRSINKQLLGQKLISKQDLLSQDPNTIYILRINYYKNPIKAKPYIYFKDRKLSKEVENAN
ncbi:MAG: type IV secretory system conjugative DNA transfer family protein [Halarcobacter ebronensis]|uniref:type IV secretory system conjugative DNA transfer family protein n=1 Tax=Halarcobacter ebronensis TaxID=1462615 RepID=UPI003C756356